MKVYEIIDGEEQLSIGCLLYFEKERSCIVELQENLDEWTAPLMFTNDVKHGRFTIGREFSHAWISERVVPRDRQNIDSILANAKMARYDEFTLLEKTNGRCCQDEMYIRRINDVPEYVKKRMEHNLIECVACDDYSLLCFFNDGIARKINLKELSDNSDVKIITSNEEVFRSCHIAAGGYCITFNGNIDIAASILYESGIELPLQLKDFISFVSSNIIDSSECCDILDCSRQNLTNYLSKDLLTPVKKNVKGNLFTKGNVYRTELK